MWNLKRNDTKNLQNRTRLTDFQKELVARWKVEDKE